jgi:DNA-binding NarL/FixJ family response regulator
VVVSAFARRVLIVDDHALTLTLLAGMLTGAGFTVASAKSAHAAMSTFDSFDPDLLLTDINLGGGVNGIELGIALRARAPYLALLYLSNYASDGREPDGFPLPSGAAFLPKADLESSEGLIEVIDAVLRDETVPHVGDGSSNPLQRLTRRQLRILQRIAQGWSNAEIARQEQLTLGAVEKLITRTFLGLGLRPSQRVNPRVLAVRLYCETVGVPPAASP